MCIGQTRRRITRFGKWRTCIAMRRKCWCGLVLPPTTASCSFGLLNGGLCYDNVGVDRRHVVRKKVDERAELLEAVSNLGKWSYWSRLWVLQEIALAESITLFCCSQRLEWCLWLAQFDTTKSPKIWQAYTSQRPGPAAAVAALWGSSDVLDNSTSSTKTATSLFTYSALAAECLAYLLCSRGSNLSQQ